jgi:hypothetical protein
LRERVASKKILFQKVFAEAQKLFEKVGGFLSGTSFKILRYCYL